MLCLVVAELVGEELSKPPEWRAFSEVLGGFKHQWIIVHFIYGMSSPIDEVHDFSGHFSWLKAAPATRI
jgi:hypothetical protein